MKDIEQRLINLKKAIEEDKAKKAKLEGAVEELQKQLEQNYGITTVEEAEKLKKKYEKDIEKNEKEITEKFARLQKLYEWE